MLEILTSGESLIAIHISAAYEAEKTRFLTPNSEPIQMGIGVFKKGGAVEPHRHVGIPATVSEFQEFIFVRRGRVLATVYDVSDRAIKRLELGPGDSLLLLRGGHAFEFLEDTEFLELKQGPYLGREQMKRVIHPKEERATPIHKTATPSEAPPLTTH